MADQISAQELESFLVELGKRYSKSATLYLLGGSALVFLGSNRPTLDIDYLGTDIPGQWDDLQRLIDSIAAEMNLKIEAVPYEGMIPILPDSGRRNISVGKYGTIQVFVLDPYAMSIGKLDRGFPTDLEDIRFLIENNFVTMPKLEELLSEILPQAEKFDMNPSAMQENLKLVRQSLTQR